MVFRFLVLLTARLAALERSLVFSCVLLHSPASIYRATRNAILATWDAIQKTRNAIRRTRRATSAHAECPAKLVKAVEHVDRLRQCSSLSPFADVVTEQMAFRVGLVCTKQATL